MSWIKSKIKWLLIIVAVGGPALAYLSWSDNRHIANVMAQGNEAVAIVTSGTARTRKGNTTYSFDLSWQDGSGRPRTAKNISVSNGMAATLVKGNALVRNRVKIKFLNEGDPVILADVDEQVAQNSTMVMFGSGGGVVAFIGLLAGFFFGGRKKAETV